MKERWKKGYHRGTVAVIIVSMLLLNGCSIKSEVAELNQVGDTDAIVENNTDLSNTVYNISIVEEFVNQANFIPTETITNQTPVTYVTLNKESIAIDGEGASVKDGNLSIKQPGTYQITGELTDGSIIVNVDEGDLVHLILNGVTINCSNSAPIYIKDAPSTQITLQEGTVNTLTDGNSYVYADTAEEEPSATIFSKDNLVINGTGELVIHANFNDAITCKDSLKIESGTYTITSKDDGIIGRDMLVIEDGTFYITSNGDALKSSNDESIESGFILLKNGEYTINSQSDGISAVSYLAVKNGIYSIVSGGGMSNSSFNSSSDSGKGLKAGNSIIVDDGRFYIDSADDSVHSNASVTVNGGEFTIASLGDGIHSDTELIINSGNILITKCYEGLEGTEITINGGDITLTASDDGINVAGGTNSSFGGRMDFFQSSGNNYLYINGGNIIVNASGDGLDSNGSIQMTGGNVVVYGPTNSGNGALDYDVKFMISGGELNIAGSTGMAQAPTTDSTQYSIMITYSQVQQANTTVTLKDSQGNVVASMTPVKQYQSVVFSNENIKSGQTYTVYSDSTEMYTCTVSDAVTYTGDGNVNQGFGGFGGGGPRPNRGESGFGVGKRN